MKSIWLLSTLALTVAAIIGAWVLISPGAGITLAVIAAMPLVPKAAFRFLSSIFLLVAIVALVADATPMISAGGSFEPTSTADHWETLSPGSLQGAKDATSRSPAGAWVWNNVLAVVIGWPTWALFGGLALLAGVAGRRRKSINIYVN